ncbi:MAG: hypothetical protein LBP87_05655 [Planctomycetaceae bacterium]|jgi:hypothetical protein|nr:hypothetical protein [Planctomycetaceae bacterium]
MEVESFNADVERRILIGMITDDTVVSSVASLWKTTNRFDFFRTDIANLVGRWAVDHYNKYSKAIRESIQSRFQSYQDKNSNQDYCKQISDLLTSLDLEFDNNPIQNRDYLIDQASRYFTEVQLDRIADRIKAGIQSGKLEDSLDAVNSFQRVELNADLGIDPLRNETAIRQAFEGGAEQLIHFNKKDEDDIQFFFGNAFSRDSFIGFLAGEKVGKSFALLDISVRAMKERRKVAFFEVGDMSQNQVIMRLMQYVTAIPKKKDFVIKVPSRLEVDKKHNIEIDYNEMPIREPLFVEDAIQKCRKMVEKHGKDELLRLSVHASGSVSVPGIVSRLDTWERSGWIPDVIVIDYADLLAPIDGKQDRRYQVDDTWKRLRGLSQSKHCLIVTATQADAASYKTKLLDKSNFSESKTKLAHVTGMVGINATPIERDQQIRRLNWIVRREEEYSELECLYVAGCLAIGRPMILGFYPKIH